MFKLADNLGFKSLKAKYFIINCGDHHLLWQIVNILFDAFAKELIHIFLQCCEYKNLQPLIENFVSWCNQRVINPNFNFYYDLIFKIFLGLICYRVGIMHNNSQDAMARGQAVTPLMLIGNHLIYQTILLNDMKERPETPKEVFEFITGNKSFSRSGNEYRGEDGDYITENENKHIKWHLGPGVPTLQYWIR